MRPYFTNGASQNSYHLAVEFTLMSSEKSSLLCEGCGEKINNETLRYNTAQITHEAADLRANLSGSR